jgi:hypothetical protein
MDFSPKLAADNVKRVIILYFELFTSNPFIKFRFFITFEEKQGTRGILMNYI